MAARQAVVLGLVVFLGGCGGPFGPCYAELIQVAFSGTLDGSQSAAAGQVAPGNIARFDDLRTVLIEGRSRPGERVVWTTDGLDGGYLFIDLPATVTAGQTVPVTSVVQGGGWGLLAGGAGGAVLGGRIGSAVITGASGSLVVLGTAPWRVRLDLTVSAAGGPRQIQGEMTFSFRRDRTACT